MSHFLTDRNPAFLTAPVQLNEAAELIGLVLTGEEDRSISSSEMAVVKDILSSSDIYKTNSNNRQQAPLSSSSFFTEHHSFINERYLIHHVLETLYVSPAKKWSSKNV